MKPHFLSGSFDHLIQLQGIETIDMHTGGEPLRVVLSGLPSLNAGTILDARAEMAQHHDRFRTILMWEPRGHKDMYGAVILPPERQDSAYGVLFMHNAGYSTMCGHATIALTKLSVLMGWVEVQEPYTEFRIDAPCGQIHCRAEVRSGKVLRTDFVNVPSFVAALDQTAMLADGSKIKYDLAYGGAYYAYVDAAELQVSIRPENTAFFIKKGMEIKQAIAQQSPHIAHPLESQLSFLYGTIFTEPSDQPGIHSRNVCMFADGEIDRSATGSGVSGRSAIYHTRGEISIGDRLCIQSIIGSEMSVEILGTSTIGSHAAIIPRVTGSAWITGRHTFYIDPDDPLGGGFLLS